MIPSYMQSDLVVSSEAWDITPLGEVASFFKGKGLPKTALSSDGVDFCIHYGELFTRYPETIREVFSRTNGSPDSFRSEANDVLMPTSDVTPRGLAKGSCVTVDGVILGGDILVIRSDKKRVFGPFLSYILRREEAQILRLVTGSTVYHLYGSDMKKFIFSLPPLSEQRAIATALSDVDALLGALERLISKKRDLKQAAMQQLLTGQTRLPGFHGEWEVKQLGEVATFLKGKGLPKSALVPDGSDPCVHYGELFTKYPETIGEIFSRTNGVGEPFRSVANDVLMPTSDVTPRGLAKASCVTIDGVILGGDILVIRSDKQRVFGPFLSYIIRREEGQVLRLVSGSTVYHLYGSDMKKFIFSLPSLAEQTAIATVLSDMDAELAALERRLAKTRALKQGMMQELLTGRTRLV